MAVEKWLDLAKKVVIVTGGSSGIGQHIVENLRANGAYTVIADLVLHEKCKADPEIMFEQCDVTNKESVESMVGAVVKKHGKIDAIINNAGVSRPQMLVDYYGEKPQYEVNEAIFDFVVNVNQKGVLLCAQAAARQMIKQKSGVIINMSSEAGINGSKGQSIYSGTKAAVRAFVASWAKELGQYNIRVVGVAPGINERTPMNDDAAFEALAYTRGFDPKDTVADYTKQIPLGRPGRLDEIADLVSFLVSDHASYITGTTINITGGKLNY